MTLEQQMILRNFRQVKINKEGYTKDKKMWFVPYRVDDRAMAVYAFDLYFHSSYRLYATEYVRARDNKQARSKIKHAYPNIVRFQWDDTYRG